MMKTTTIEYYRDWRIYLALGDNWVATIVAPDGSGGVRVERESEVELFAAAVDLIDNSLIDRYASNSSPLRLLKAAE